MKLKLILAAFCLTPLVACTPVTSPSNVSQGTVIDEKAALGAELAYTTSAKLGLALVQAGLIDKEKFKAANDKAYAALLIVRQAYKTANAANFDYAITQLYAAVNDINTLVK